MQHWNSPLRSHTLFLLALLFATAVTLPVFAQKTSVHPSLITGAIDENQLVPLKGNLHPAAIAANDRGIVDDGEPLGHVILLLNRAPELEKQLEATIDQLHNPKSTKYHQWLTAEQFGEQYGLSDADLKTVTDWLQAKGFMIEDVPPGRTHIVFTGTVGQIRTAFHTEIHKINVHGQLHRANMNEPEVPAALAPAIRGFRQLTDFRAKPLLVDAGVVKHNRKTGRWEPVPTPGVAPAFTFTDTPCTLTYNGSCTFYAVTPQDFYTIYNENPVLNNGINGAGVTIAVIEETEVVNQSDVASFRSQFGLAAYPATPNLTQGGVNWMYGPGNGCTAPPDPTSAFEEHEALLDVEWAGAVAPNAIVDFVACTTVDIAASYVVNYLYSTVSAASLSYLDCEIDTGSSGASFYSGLWQQGAAEGITHVVASADSGPTVCDDKVADATHNISVNAMASTAYNVSAGGTDFGDAYITEGYVTSPASTWWNTTDTPPYGSALSYLPEITWGGYCSNPLVASYLEATGNTTYGTTYTPVAICNNSTAIAAGLLKVKGGSGGVSIYNALPTWQSVYGIGSAGNSNNTSTTFRNQPDVSLFAASGLWNHFLLFCDSDTGYAPCTYSNSTDAYALKGGGTSFVAPQLAGAMALIVQKTGQRQGVANYTLYGLAAQEYGTTNAPNTSELATCSGSAQGAAVGSSCIFRDISNDTPSLQTGTIASDIAQPCQFSVVTTCWEPSSMTYGITSLGNHPATEHDAYVSSPGYDLATGLGSVNISNLVNSWNTLRPGFASTTALSASASSIPPSGSVTLTATVTATGRGGAVAPAGVVGFYEGSTSGTRLGQGNISPSCTGSGAATACNGVATLILLGSALNPGSNSIVAYFEGDGANDNPSTSTAVSVTVTVPTVSLTPTALIFPSTKLGSSSAVQVVTLKNTGGATLDINTGGITISGVDASSFTKTTTCGTTLAAGASCTISVTFKPAATGALTAALNVADNASGSPQAVSLNGTGTQVSLSPATLAFGTVATSKALSVTVKNLGTTALTFSSAPTITGTGAARFAVSVYSSSPATSTFLNPALTSLAQNATCTYTVTFNNADATTAATAALNVFDNGGGSPQTVAMTGTGTEVSLSPATLAFGTVTTSKTLSLTVKNLGTTALTFSSAPSITGTGAAKFAVQPYSSSPATSTCLNPALTSLAQNATCTYTVTFTNGVDTTSFTASLNIFDNGGGSPQVEAMTGNGTEVTRTPATLAFGTVTTSKTLAVTIENVGTTPLAFSKAPSITGTGAAKFAVQPYSSSPSTSTCLDPALTTLAQDATCTYTVTFTNGVDATSFTASLNIFDNGGGSPQVEAMSGNGTEVSLSPATLAFGTVTTNSTLAVTVENVGTTALTFSKAPTITGTGSANFAVLPYSATGPVSTCLNGTVTLAQNATCTYTVKFTNAGGTTSFTTKLNIFDNGGASPQAETMTATD